MLCVLLVLQAVFSSVMAQGKAWTPDTITWQQVNADGTKYTVLEGRRDIPGEAFTYAFFIPAGVWDSAHSHTADARVVVVKGRLKLGYGRALDKQTARDFPVGSYLLVPADANHFDGADEDTIIIGTAVGPWKTTYVK
ncbi:MAG TPA: cupin domain-containing protein [Vicinamibacterales bacterium]|nr:cupin domain-containing protein [Vicinamibacterales bacterium]